MCVSFKCRPGVMQVILEKEGSVDDVSGLTRTVPKDFEVLLGQVRPFVYKVDGQDMSKLLLIGFILKNVDNIFKCCEMKCHTFQVIVKFIN